MANGVSLPAFIATSSAPSSCSTGTAGEAPYVALAGPGIVAVRKAAEASVSTLDRLGRAISYLVNGALYAGPFVLKS